RAYEPVDDVDRVSCRPDFAVLVYPAYLVTKDRERLAPDIRVGKTTPPMFLVHAENDPVPVQNSIRTYLALQEAGVHAEMHIYTRGVPGSGLRPSDNPCSPWPRRCADWMKSQGLLKAGAAH